MKKFSKLMLAFVVALFAVGSLSACSSESKGKPRDDLGEVEDVK